MECPDETTLSDFLVGCLPQERRASVLAHVERCSLCQRALGSGEEGFPDSAPPQDSLTLTRGATLSRYVVRERIGQGAMGVVYAAYDPDLDRQVALKLLRPEGRQVEDLRARLLREAQSLARLSHPNVVTVHDVGTCDGGVFLAMELVEGSTLAEWMKQPHSWAEVLRIFQEAGRGLAAAHSAGLVHRDFKPANVLMGRDGRVRVTDFGLARPSEPYAPPTSGTRSELPARAGDSSESLTETGALLGTPAYMAPEQLEGGRADALSDQFSFCVALYEGLFQERPFQGLSLEELRQASAEGRLRPPRRDRKVPSWLYHTVLRGLRAHPQERFPSMDALLVALTPRPRRARAWAMVTATLFLAGVASAYALTHRAAERCAQEAAKIAAAWGPTQRERVHAAFTATGKPYAEPTWEKVASVLDGYAAQWSALRTETCVAMQEDSSTRAWQAAACLDNRLWQLTATTSVLARADARTVQNARQMVASLEGLTGCRDVPDLSARPQPPDALTPQVEAVRHKVQEAQAQLAAGRYAEGLEQTTGLLKEARALGYRPLEAEVLLVHAESYLLLARYKEGEELLNQAVLIAEAGRDNEMEARAWVRLIQVVGVALHRLEDANRIAQHAQATVERLGRERFPEIAIALHLRLGDLLIIQEKWDPAEGELKQGLALLKQTRGEGDPLHGRFLDLLATLRRQQGRLEESLALQQQALTIQEALLGTSHPSLVLNLDGLAKTLEQLGRREEAIASWRRSMAIDEAYQLTESSSFAIAMTNLAAALRYSGKREEAKAYLERALPIFERTQGPNHSNSTAVLLQLALVSCDMNQYEQAISYSQQALERAQRVAGATSTRAAMSLKIRAVALFQTGRYEEARNDVQQGLRMLKENSQDETETADSLRLLGQIYLSMGVPKEALASCQRSKEIDERVLGAQSEYVAGDLSCLAEALLALRDAEQAMPLLERARQILGDTPSDLMDTGVIDFLRARALMERRTAPDLIGGTALQGEARKVLKEIGPRGLLVLKRMEARRRLQRSPAGPGN